MLYRILAELGLPKSPLLPRAGREVPGTGKSHAGAFISGAAIAGHLNLPFLGGQENPLLGQPERLEVERGRQQPSELPDTSWRSKSRKVLAGCGEGV